VYPCATPNQTQVPQMVTLWKSNVCEEKDPLSLIETKGENTFKRLSQLVLMGSKLGIEVKAT